MAFWWVNQGQTWRDEIYGEYLWSPKLNKAGKRHLYYENMLRLQPADIVFSYVRGQIRHVGIVVRTAETSRQPIWGSAQANWNEDGWSVEMRYISISGFRPADYLDVYQSLGPERNGPIDAFGMVVRQYLFALTDPLGEYYLSLAELSEQDLRDLLRFDPSADDEAEPLQGIDPDRKLTVTERRQLIRARMGQGLFKSRVLRWEPSCRLTGLADASHLIASHMKPWSKSTNAERLDGSNGLLLSPHVDHLFDRGLISFKNSGSVIVSKRLKPVVPELWKLDLMQQGRSFRRAQIPFLEYHRDEIFETG